MGLTLIKIDIVLYFVIRLGSDFDVDSDFDVRRVVRQRTGQLNHLECLGTVVNRVTWSV